MDPHAIKEEPPRQTEKRGDSVSGSTVLEDARSLGHELRGLVYDQFRLAALETRRAGESLVSMIEVGVIIASLLSGAWLGLVAAAVVGLIENGVVASRAILLGVAGILLLALILCGVLRRKSRDLLFPATLRSLQPMPPVHPNAEK